MRKSLFALLAILCISCSQSSSTFSKPQYCIGIDPSFFPVEIAEQTTNVYAFASEVLQHIGKMNGIEIQVIDLSWDNLIDSLMLGRVDAVISSAPPNLINSNKYNFSTPLLRTGPVLVVPKTSKFTNLSELEGMVVATGYGNEEIEIIANYPKTEFVFYDRFTSALELVTLGNLQGTLIPVVPAGRYIANIFHDLKIVSIPLTNEALRLITPMKGSKMNLDSSSSYSSEIAYDRHKSLLALFDTSINTMLDDGEYNKLLYKWNLTQ